MRLSATFSPAASPKYEDLYDTEVRGRTAANLKQADREQSLQALMTVNLLKRLESSVEAFRLTLTALSRIITARLSPRSTPIEKTGRDASFADVSDRIRECRPGRRDEFPDPDDEQIGGKVQISLSDMDLPRLGARPGRRPCTHRGLCMTEMQQDHPVRRCQASST